MSSESENGLKQNHKHNNAASLRDCLVDDDADRRTSDRRIRWRSLIVSVVVQISVLAVLVLVPILSRTERIALAKVMPMPPYHPAAGADRAPQHPHPASRPHGFSFCLSCAPAIAHPPTLIHDSAPGPVGNDPIDLQTGDPPSIECSECSGLIGKGSPPPIAPLGPTPSIVHVTHLDPAMLIHRVEPVFPTLARQNGREGSVELQAIIATDGTIRSVQWIGGDALFYQSALDAVRQWRYQPTFLNGHPVEVDTHITVIYKINR